MVEGWAITMQGFWFSVYALAVFVCIETVGNCCARKFTVGSGRSNSGGGRRGVASSKNFQAMQMGTFRGLVVAVVVTVAVVLVPASGEISRLSDALFWVRGFVSNLS